MEKNVNSNAKRTAGRLIGAVLASLRCNVSYGKYNNKKKFEKMNNYETIE